MVMGRGLTRGEADLFVRREIPISFSGFWAGRYFTAQLSAWSLGVWASATSFIGGEWRKRTWKHGMEKTIEAIAREHGFDDGSAAASTLERKHNGLGHNREAKHL
jgi:hypothetical protein